MRPGLAAGQHGRTCRLYGHGAEGGLARFEHFGDARQRAPCADAGHEDVRPAVRVAPDLLGGRLAVYPGIGRVLKLVGHETVRRLGDDLLGPAHGAGHALGSGCEQDGGPERLEHAATLDGHRLRHRKYQLVALGCADVRQADSGIAAGGLDDGAARPDLARLLRGLDHGVRDAILDAPERVEGFHLGDHLRSETSGQPVQTHERCVAYTIDDGIQDMGHGRTSSFAPGQVR